MKEHLKFIAKSPRRSKPSKSGLLEPPKEAQGKKGGAHKNPWRPNRKSPYSEIHHNNNPLVVCFLEDQKKAKECRQCRVEFPRRQMIAPFDIVLSHEEKWMYPSPDDPDRKLPSSKFTTKFYCVKRQCIMTRFPYFDASFLQVDKDARLRLRPSHLGLLKAELNCAV